MLYLKQSSRVMCGRVCLYLCTTVILSVTTLFAQTGGKISGFIADAENGEPLIGVNVFIVGTTMGAASDYDGNYYILNVPPGKYDVQVSIIGYQRMQQRNVIVNSDKTTTLDFKLKQEAVVSDIVVVEAVRPDIVPEKTSTSEIIRFDDVQGIAGMRDVGDVIGLAADVTDGHFRGGRTGEELYTLQGMGITNPLDNSSAILPIMSAVEEVEVITSGFEVQYGNAQSGVVNISMKEGKSDKWHSRLETRGRAAGRKHFGPSVYDPRANPYLGFLLDSSVWRGTQEDTRYYTQMVDQFNSYFGLDTNARVKVAYALWRYQTKRDLNLDYGNDIDNSIEFSTGGPLDDKRRMFIALRSNTQWPRFPTEQPDEEQQIMGNIVSDFGGGVALRLSGAYTLENRNVFPSADNLGFYNWMWDRILSVQYRKRTNSQFGIRFNQALSSSTFYELKLNALITTTKQGFPISPDWLNDEYLGLVETNFSRMIASTRSGPDRFTYGSGGDDFRDELTRTLSFEGSISSQVTKSHYLNGGLQINSYLLDINNRSNVRNNTEGMELNQYSARPYEAALYLQDKMEFEGMVARIGLRWDVWAQNTKYYTDVFSPYRVVLSELDSYYSKDDAPKAETPIIGRLQPRIGVSFPVTLSTVFHLNYGSFMQRPSFQYVLATEWSQGSDLPNEFGNPRLQPQITNMYDVGINQGLGEGFTLDVSGYYKDVKNQVQSAIYTDRGGETYTTYINRDYADIRGFRVSLNKRRGSFTGALNYQYGVATGKSSTPQNASPAYQEEPNTGEIIEDLENVPIRDIVLDFDQTHNLIISLVYSTGKEAGPILFGTYPFSNIIISGNSFVRSGKPYTYSIGVRQINNKRTPYERNVNLKFSKKISGFFDTDLSLYFEIFNVTDERILNYDYIFDQSNSNSSFNITRYETAPVNSTQGIRYLNASNGSPFLVDQSFLIYENSPRSYNFGIVMEF